MHSLFTAISISIFATLTSAPDPQESNSDSQDVDVVVLKKASGEGETKRKGRIVAWAGDVITIEGKTGVKEVDTDRLVRIETAWHPGYQQGKKLFAEHRFNEAIEQLNSAIESEERDWMLNIVFAELVKCHMAKEDFGSAAQAFFKVIDDDPQSRFRHLVPLVWTSSRPKGPKTKRAADWLKSGDPTVALLGASWLLDDRSQKDAKPKMESLADDFDPTIASLARAQLWRLDSVAAEEKRIDIRIRQTRAMPENVRCGAWYLIAQAQSKRNLHNKAILNFMRIPVNDPQQPALAAAALYQTAWLLDNTDRQGQAKTLRRELKEKFGETVWAN